MADIVLNTDDLEITVSERGETNLASNLGSGEGLATTKSGVTLQFKSISAGNNIAVSSDANSVTIANNMDFGSVDEHILPDTNITYDIGDQSSRFQDLFIKDFDIQYNNSRSEITSNEVYWDATDNALEIDTGAADLTLRTDASNNVVVPQNLVVNGSLDVNGTLTTIDTTNLAVSDQVIELNRGAASNTTDAGIIIERGSTGDNAAIFWDESEDVFKLATTTSTGSETGDFAGLALQDLHANTVDTYEGLYIGNNSNANRLYMRGGVNAPLGLFIGEGFGKSQGKAQGFLFGYKDNEDNDTTKYAGSIEWQPNTGSANSRFRVRHFSEAGGSPEQLISLRYDDSCHIGIKDVFTNGSDGYTQGLMKLNNSQVQMNRRTDMYAPAEADDDEYIPVNKLIADYSHRHTTSELEAAIDYPKAVTEYTIKTSDNTHFVANIMGQRHSNLTYKNELVLEARDPGDNGMHGYFKVGQNYGQFETVALGNLRVDSGTTDPASPSDGDWFFNRTSGSVALKRYNGTSWDTPVNTDGTQFYDNTANKMVVRINGAWHEMDTTAI